MHYVVSDIHGYYEKYKELLRKINFNDEDILYVLGDVMDRGPEPIKVLQDIMRKSNVKFILGNHDYLLYYFVSQMGYDLSIVNCDKDLRYSYNSWLRDGGIPTDDAFYNLSIEEKKKSIKFLKNASPYEELEVDGIKYILVHAGIQNYEPDKPMEQYDYAELLEGRTDYSKPLFEIESKVLVTGHTPTFFLRGDWVPEVFIGNGHIAVDCGVAYGGKLGAYCFETKKCVYV